MLENDPVSPLILRAKSRAQGTLHQDGVDSIVEAARWFLLFLAIIAVFRWPSWKVFLPAFGTAFLLDLFAVDRLTEFLRGKWIYPRIGYVAVEGETVSPKNLPWHLRPVAMAARAAESLWLLVLFFSTWWGFLLGCFGPALAHSIKHDVNRWPRHFLLLVTSLFVVLSARTMENLTMGIALITVICLTDGLMRLAGFLRAHSRDRGPSL
jgi:hypothetical protein